ncbi:MAG TPA: RNA-binding protein [Aquabacterium sp.]|nr:RNA-binding protein [Aquabacterium sp.]
MKPFELSKDMLNMRGQFYPTGYVVVMIPSMEAAQRAVKALTDAGLSEDDISLLTPEVIQSQIVRTVGNGDMPLPSAGTEGDTVRRFSQYASQGHHALLIHSPKGDHGDRIMAALRGHEVSYAQKYRSLVIEDLV